MMTQQKTGSDRSCATSVADLEPEGDSGARVWSTPKVFTYAIDTHTLAAANPGADPAFS